MKSFVLRTCVLWRINNFSGDKNLFGWLTKSQCACPLCSTNYDGVRLGASKNYSYWSSRRWRQMDHHFRQHKKNFEDNFELMRYHKYYLMR